MLRRDLGRFAGAAAAVFGTGLGPALAAESSGPFYGPSAADAMAGGTLVMGSLVEPPGLDPFHVAAEARIRITVLIYQGLFYEAPNGDAVPLLAEGFDLSPDRLTYTVKLRSGIMFHNGQKMTAKDVAYSYNYIRDPKNGSPGAADFAMIQAVRALDDLTVRFTLSQPNGSMPMTLGNKFGGVVPAGTFDAPDAAAKLNQASLGTGPFKIGEFKPNSNLMLVRHAGYWENGAPYLDAVNFVFVPSSPTLLVGLRNKRVDLATLNRPQDVKQVEGAPGLKLERWPSLNQKSIDLGLEYAPLADVRVRQAIALAIDKDEVMRASIGGLGIVIGTIPAAMADRWGLPADQMPNRGPDLDRARALLAESGHGAGLDVTLTTIVGYDWMDPAAVTLREQLGKVGIRLTIQRVELGVWAKNFQAKQMGFTFNDWASQPDPNLLFYRHFHSAPGGADFRNWRDEKASALLDQGRAEADPSKRRAIYQAFQSELAATVPTIMMFSADHLTIRGERVRNYVQHPTGWYYGLARTYLTA